MNDPSALELSAGLVIELDDASVEKAADRAEKLFNQRAEAAARAKSSDPSGPAAGAAASPAAARTPRDAAARPSRDGSPARTIEPADLTQAFRAAREDPAGSLADLMKLYGVSRVGGFVAARAGIATGAAGAARSAGAGVAGSAGGAAALLNPYALSAAVASGIVIGAPIFARKFFEGNERKLEAIFSRGAGTSPQLAGLQLQREQQAIAREIQRGQLLAPSARRLAEADRRAQDTAFAISTPLEAAGNAVRAWITDALVAAAPYLVGAVAGPSGLAAFVRLRALAQQGDPNRSIERVIERLIFLGQRPEAIQNPRQIIGAAGPSTSFGVP